MLDPMMDKYGHSYERSAIVAWINQGNTSCPLTRRELRLSQLVRNSYLKAQIDNWRKQNDDEPEEEVVTTKNVDLVIGICEFSYGSDEEWKEELLVAAQNLTPEQKELIKSICKIQFSDDDNHTRQPSTRRRSQATIRGFFRSVIS
jgi:hypothetical protein